MIASYLMKFNPHKIVKNNEIESSTPLFFISTEPDYKDSNNWKNMEFLLSLEAVLQGILDSHQKSDKKELFVFVFRLHDEVSFSEEEILMTDDECVFIGSLASFLIPYSSEVPYFTIDINTFLPVNKFKTNYHASFCKNYGKTDNFWDISLKRKIQWLLLSKSSKFNSVLLISQLSKFYKGYFGSIIYDSKSDSNWFAFYHFGFLFYFHGDIDSLTNYMKNSSLISNIVSPSSSKVSESVHHLNFLKVDSKDLKGWDVFESKLVKGTIDSSEIGNWCHPQTRRENTIIHLNVARKDDIKIPEVYHSGFIIPE